MDQSKLIDEIVSRVAAKLAESGEVAAACDTCGACADAAKPGLLILTQQHGEVCHAGLESEALHKCFRTDCALLHDYQVNIADYDVIVLYQLTNETLGKLACGVCDTPYTKLATQAILMGKRIYVPTEEVELFRYASTAPAAYYAMMKEKLDLLTRSGMTISAQGNLERAILSGCACPGPAPSAPAGPCSLISDRPCPERQQELSLTKRVLTERDVSAAIEGRFSRIRLPAKCIVTSLAQDYAKDHGISLVRE